MLSYANLSRSDRKAARRLAKELLRTVPAAREGEQPRSVRGALSTVFMKPQNVVGVLVYSDHMGNWWGDVAFRSGSKCYQMGTPEEAPLDSYEDAFEHVKGFIARIKATREHPLVGEFRRQGIDPEKAVLMRVRHEAFGHRYALLDGNEIAEGAERFTSYVEDNFPGVADKLEQARTIVLQMAPRLATHPEFLQPRDHDSGDEQSDFQLLGYAAAFLVKSGIINIDQDATGTTQDPLDIDRHTLH
jgi:hypothetical protein